MVNPLFRIYIDSLVKSYKINQKNENQYQFLSVNYLNISIKSIKC